MPRPLASRAPRPRRNAKWLIAPLAIAALVALAAFTPSRSRAEAPTPQSESRNSQPAPKLPEEPRIRVRTARGADVLNLTAPGRILAKPEGRPMIPLRVPVRVTCNKGALTLAVGDQRYNIDPAIPVTFRSANPGSIRIDGVRTGTQFILRPAARSKRQIDVIALVPMETYVAGVIVSELFPDWSPETFAAQAIAARSYAMWRMRVAERDKANWDVENTQADQVYRGVTEHPNAVEQTAATRGVVLKDPRGILPAFYSSTCGGRPQSALDAWPERRFDLLGRTALIARSREHTCSAASRYRWEITRSPEEIRARMRTLADEIPELADFDAILSMTVSRRNAADRPTHYNLLTKSGIRAEIPAERLRQALNTEVPGFPRRDFRKRVLSSDLEIVPTDDAVTIRGRGFGHGVGMCQFCAEGFAKQGKSAAEMLKLFYPTATLERVYE